MKCIVFVFFCWMIGFVSPQTPQILPPPILGNNGHMEPLTTLPYFFVIGVPKASTTSLHSLLTSHPEVCRPRLKEPHYFDSPYPVRDAKFGGTRVMDYFTVSNGDHTNYFRMLGRPCRGKGYVDSTTQYFYTPRTPGRMKLAYGDEELKKVRIVLVLRNPVTREFSWYQHNYRLCTSAMKTYMFQATANNIHRRGMLSRDLQQQQQMNTNGGEVISNSSSTLWNSKALCEDFHCDILKCRERSHLASLRHAGAGLATYNEYVREGLMNLNYSKYLSHLENWLEFFSRDQILILNFERLVSQTQDTVTRISDFFGLSSGWWDSNTELPHFNEALVKNVHDCESMRRVEDYFQPYNLALYQFLNSTAKKSPLEPVFEPFREVKPCT